METSNYGSKLAAMIIATVLTMPICYKLIMFWVTIYGQKNILVVN